MDHFQYLCLMAGCLALTLPLEFVFRARVYRRPRRLFRAMVVPVAVFVVWDLVAIARGHWAFDARYVTGWELPGSLPVEEFVFFLVIPVCALLTFEASRRTLDR
ncbi:lycopene cyclase domain-containing protein [Actinospongicola halichondriae]|uniref:lycopene cyclase domain-containing protein n=1 Tax=Actinospongicola halichondriae TaxID=3236844 RepID=UPI003D4ADA77